MVKKLRKVNFNSFYWLFHQNFGSFMQGKQTGEFIRALSVALRLLFYFFIAMLWATNWQVLLPLVISIITCGKQRQLWDMRRQFWDMRLYLSDQKIRTKRLRLRGTCGLNVMKIFVDQIFIRLFFPKKSVKYFFKIN